MDQFAGPAVTVGPERAFRAHRPMVIDVFFMRAADDRLWHHHAADAELLEEADYLFDDVKVLADIALVAIPFAHLCGLATLVLNNGRDQLGSAAIVRTIAG